ncbi:lytic polysaccharide monooxygenase [Microbulbifer elongatus]|uniref:lytic polysaccharide monooxygenase n=1 Tax=Microbulbifer elongatus TaxID=86173 RepID=UPI001E62382F|nr:lytic polysaccharide monooxygenase [Microbulbifer elongatus]
MNHTTRKGLAPLALALGALPAIDAHSHGTMEVPESRIYNCFLNNPESPSDPACAAAKAVGGTQPFYDWNEINQANAAGNHRALVPDGELCAGGRDKYAGMNLARSDWQATPITPKADGTFDFVFWGTAPHATDAWVFYITRNGYTGNEPLKWDDLFEFCRLGNVPVGADKRYTLNCPLPQLTGKHVIYTTWQRSDSPEAFYTCTDVILGDGGTPSQWADEGALQAYSDLAAGSVVTLRLFNANGNDLETIGYTLEQDASAADWALAFANAINSQSQYARIGVLDPVNDTVSPIASASENRVYTQADLNLSHEVDIQPADNGGDPGNGDGGGDTGGDGYDYTYPDGIGNYVPGETVVLGSDNNRYHCRPFPQGQWCNINSAYHYAPGTGTNWEGAWIKL